MQNCVAKDHTSKKHEENHCCDEDMNNQLQKALLKYSNGHIYIGSGDVNPIILPSRFKNEAIEELFDGLVFQFKASGENTEPVLLALAKTNPRQLVYNNELLPSGFLKKDVVYSVQYSAEDDRFHILNIGSTVYKPKIVFNTIEEAIIPASFVTTASDWTSFYHKEIKVTKPSILVFKFYAETNLTLIPSTYGDGYCNGGIYLSFRGFPGKKTSYSGHYDTNGILFNQYSCTGPKHFIHTFLQDSMFLNANANVNINIYARAYYGYLKIRRGAAKIYMVELGE